MCCWWSELRCNSWCPLSWRSRSHLDEPCCWAGLVLLVVSQGGQGHVLYQPLELVISGHKISLTVDLSTPEKWRSWLTTRGGHGVAESNKVGSPLLWRRLDLFSTHRWAPGWLCGPPACWLCSSPPSGPVHGATVLPSSRTRMTTWATETPGHKVGVDALVVALHSDTVWWFCHCKQLTRTSATQLCVDFDALSAAEDSRLDIPNCSLKKKFCFIGSIPPWITVIL